MEQEKNVNTKDESPIATLVNMVKEPKKVDDKEQREITTNSHAEKFRTLSFVVIAIGLLAGVICGIAFPAFVTKDIGTYSSVITTEKTFNFGLMLIVWLGSAGAAIFPLVVYCILDCMDNILIELKRANHYHKQNTEKE